MSILEDQSQARRARKTHRAVNNYSLVRRKGPAVVDAQSWLRRTAKSTVHSILASPQFELHQTSPLKTRPASVKAADAVDPHVRAIFDAHARRLAESTRFVSSTEATIRHPSYLRIIGLGEKALPILLSQLVSSRSGMWFPALVAIVGEDLAEGESTVQGAVSQWLRWGSRQGLL